jgi:hypothetical protein
MSSKKLGGEKMKCFNCEYCRKSKAKNYKYHCKKFDIPVQDELNGCEDGKEKTNKEAE